jgi:hypothetical protein
VAEHSADFYCYQRVTILGGHGSERTSASANGQGFLICPRYVDALAYTIYIESILFYFMQLPQLMLSVPSREGVLLFQKCVILYLMRVHVQLQCWELGATCLEQSLVTRSSRSSKRRARDLKIIIDLGSHVLVYHVSVLSFFKDTHEYLWVLVSTCKYPFNPDP